MAQVTRHDARLFGARRMISAPDRIVIACEHSRRLVVATETLDIVGASDPLPAPAMDVVGSGSYYFVAGSDGSVHRLSFADTPVRDMSVTIGDPNPHAWIAASGSTIFAGGKRGEIVAMSQALAVTGRTIGLGRHVAAVVASGFLYAFDGAGRVACIEIAGMVTRSIVNVPQAVDVVQAILVDGDIIVACGGLRSRILTLDISDQDAPTVTDDADVDGVCTGVLSDMTPIVDGATYDLDYSINGTCGVIFDGSVFIANPNTGVLSSGERWTETFLFTDGQRNFAPARTILDQSAATWSTDKWASIYDLNASGDSEVRIYQDTPSTARLTRLTIEYDATLSGTELLTPFGTEVVTLAAGTGVTLTRTGDVTTSTWRFDLFADNKNSTMAFRRITLSGTGTNPFRWETVSTNRITSLNGPSFGVALGTNGPGLYRLRYTGSGAGNGDPSVTNNWVALGAVYVDGVQYLQAEFPPGGNGLRRASGSVVEAQDIGGVSAGVSMPGGVFDLRWPDPFPGPPNTNQDYNAGPQFELQIYT